MASVGDDGDELAAVLRELGAGPDVVAALVANPTTDIPAEVLCHRHAELTARQLADRAGLPVDDIERVYHLLGVDIPDLDQVLFTPAELDFCRMISGAGEGLLPRSEFDDLLRLIGNSLARIADGTVAAYVQTVEAPIHAAGGQPIDMFRSMLVGVEVMEHLRAAIAAMLAHHLRVAITRQRRAQAGVRTRLHYRVAVGFVDLVGFTALTQSMDASELADMVRAFESSAFDAVAAAGGRVLKHVGDEVMFTAPDADAGCAAARALVGGFADERIRPRGGLAYGDVVTRGGDHYGTVVNLASRLTDEAVPDEILADASVVEAVGDRFSLEPAGRRQLKGFQEPVSVWSLT